MRLGDSQSCFQHFEGEENILLQLGFKAQTMQPVV